jgi:hypothetical protein
MEDFKMQVTLYKRRPWSTVRTLTDSKKQNCSRKTSGSLSRQEIPRLSETWNFTALTCSVSPSGTLRRVTEQLVPDVSRQDSGFIWKANKDLMTQWRSSTTRKDRHTIHTASKAFKLQLSCSQQRTTRFWRQPHKCRSPCPFGINFNIILTSASKLPKSIYAVTSERRRVLFWQNSQKLRSIVQDPPKYLEWKF